MSKKPIRKRVKNWLVYQFIRGMIWALRHLPRPIALWLFEKLGILAFHILRSEREKSLRHLEIAFGNLMTKAEIETTAKESFRALGRNAADAIRLPQVSRNGFEKYIRVVGYEHLESAFKRGNGVVCITGHIGCWELLGAVIAKHFPLAVVGAKIYDERLDAILVEARAKAGYRSFPRTAGGTKQILRWLREGNVLGVLIDQDTRVDGEFVDFFGQPAYTPIGPLLLAERTNAAIIPMAIQMNADFSHTIEIKPEIHLQHTGDAQADRVANILQCSKAIETFIRANPTQWVWMHERWKTKENI